MSAAIGPLADLARQHAAVRKMVLRELDEAIERDLAVRQ
jgi:hypothetical protein